MSGTTHDIPLCANAALTIYTELAKRALSPEEIMAFSKKSFLKSPCSPRLSFWLLATVLIIMADQASKIWIRQRFSLGGGKQINDFLNIVHVNNPGAAFSFLANASGWQKPALIIVGIIAVVTVFILLYRHHQQKLFAFAMTCILSGAIGNLIDRFAYGAVIDFIDFHWGRLHWPAFNIADVAISAGAIALIVDELRRVRSKR
ncbi:MAG: signal peptidase II [Burkholderiaceae bacterium]|jgi:signal peptidase II